MHLLLVGDSNEHKKAKGVNKNVVATISHGEYKDALLNKERVRHLMNRIQRKDDRIGTMKSTRFFCLALTTKFISKATNTMH